MLATSRNSLVWWISGYFVLLVCIIVVMFWQQQKVLQEYSTPTALDEWNAWRNDVERQQTNPGPVARRVPKSVEPPALVLMRDYFGVSLVGATFFTSILYWIVVWFVTGALQSDYRINEQPPG